MHYSTATCHWIHTKHSIIVRKWPHGNDAWQQTVPQKPPDFSMAITVANPVKHHHLVIPDVHITIQDRKTPLLWGVVWWRRMSRAHLRDIGPQPSQPRQVVHRGIVTIRMVVITPQQELPEAIKAI